MLRIMEDGSGSKENGLLADLDELAREGARRMLVSALDAGLASMWRATGAIETRRAAPWWCAMEKPVPAR